MVAARRLVGLARGGAASQPGPDGGRTDEQDEITPLDRHPDTLPRVVGTAGFAARTGRELAATGSSGRHFFLWFCVFSG
jgi:hypothetical protein